MPRTHQDYQCPTCESWIEILPTTNQNAFDCPWCKEPLYLNVDAEFRDGMWRDLSRLCSNRKHIEKMIEHGKADQG